MIERSVPLITETSDGICTSVKIEKVNDSADQTKFSSCVLVVFSIKNSSPLAITVVSLHACKLDVFINLSIAPEGMVMIGKHLYGTEFHSISEQASWKIAMCELE